MLVTNHTEKTTNDTTVSIKESVTIDHPRSKLYAFWRDVGNAGEIRFIDVARDGWTEIHVNIEHRLPAGDVGSLAAKLMNPAFLHLIEKRMYVGPSSL
jgi:uncharacterized membrane protein